MSKKRDSNIPDFGDMIQRMKYSATLSNLPAFKSIELLSSRDFKINPNTYKSIKPLSESILEAVQALQAELFLVRSELIAAKQKADRAEQRTLDAERKAELAEVKADKTQARSYWLGMVAFLVSFLFSVWQYVEQQSERKEKGALESRAKIIYQQIQNLEAEADKVKIVPSPVTPLLNNTLHKLAS